MAHSDATAEVSRKFGFVPGQIIQEFYFDDDVDMELRSDIESLTGEELVDEDFTNTTDAAIIWWRAEDAEVDELSDLLVDAIGNLDDGGDIWVLTPKAGRDQYVSSVDIEDAASTAGLHASGTIDAATDWMGMRLVVRAPRV
ncbi:MAG: DUF3052 domain-containing protein [Bowdeniella nasicola]|nr:DUF3052 domain-containing protein [Bowdeniella nasicola]